jgi:hypothetical protein
MHRNARKLDEGTNRQLLQLTNEQDLLGRFVQASMHKKLAMGHQMGRALTAQDPFFKRLLEKAVDEQIEQEVARLEQLSTLKSKDRNPGISGGDPDEQQILGEKMMPHQNPENPLGPKVGHSERGKFGWNHGTMVLKPLLKDPKIRLQ